MRNGIRQDAKVDPHGVGYACRLLFTVCAQFKCHCLVHALMWEGQASPWHTIVEVKVSYSPFMQIVDTRRQTRVIE